MVDTARKNITTACIPCRRSKQRCDGQTPQCRNCHRKRRSCQYGQDEDRRRIAYRPALGILRDHIAALEDQLHTLAIKPVAVAEDDRESVNKVLEAAGFPSLLDRGDDQSARSRDDKTIQPALTYTFPPRRQEGHFGDQVGINDPSSTLPFWDEGVFSSLDWPWGPSFPADLEPPLDTSAGNQAVPEPLPTQLNDHHEGRDATPIDNEAENELINQIAARFGSLQVASDGRLRYFGGSNACLSPDGTFACPVAMPKVDEEKLFRDADLNRDMEPALVQHLIELFFTWHNSVHPVVDRTTRPDGKSECSSLLTNAMCAIGAAYEPNDNSLLNTFPRSLADFFADRAKLLLDAELDSPSVSGVQSLLLLSSHETARQHTAKSWLYSGMAMRLCFDLGLHIDYESYVSQGILSASAAQNRQLAFWASYIQNYRASFSSGRPFTVDSSEIRVRKPDARSQASMGFWTPYRIPPETPSSGYAAITPDLLGSIAEQRVMLSELVEPIIRALYGNANMKTKELQELSHKTTTILFDWKTNLSARLQMAGVRSPSVTPQLLVLHLEYQYLQILIHRPWTSQKLQPVPAQGPGHQHARSVCVESACEMAHILSIFETRFSFRRLDVETIQMVPAATLILIFAAVSTSAAGTNDSQVMTALGTLFRALNEASNMHPSARDHLESLMAIQERWGQVYEKHRSQEDYATVVGTETGPLK